MTWRADEALSFAFPVAVDDTLGFREVAVARGNVAPAHHGRLVDGPGTLAPIVPERSIRPGTRRRPSSSPRAAHQAETNARAAAASRCGPTAGRTASTSTSRFPSGQEAHPEVLSTLLDAPAGDLAAVVEIEDDFPPVLRFAAGSAGAAPPFGSSVRAAYEVGGGERGNAPGERPHGPGAEHGRTACRPELAGRGKRPPRAQSRRGDGGTAPTPLDDVRRDAPEAFAAEPRRAVLPADHAAIAGASPLVQRAAATKSWTGAWPLITTRVDLAVADAATALPALAAAAEATRLLGTEAYVIEGRAIGLLVSLELCATPGADPALVRNAALALLRPGTDDRPGVFHRSRLELGRSVYVSAVVAAVAALPQVDAVEVVEARRLDEPRGTVRAVIAFAPDEVAVLDDDPARPERGRLDIRVRGSR